MDEDDPSGTRQALRDMQQWHEQGVAAMRDATRVLQELSTSSARTSHGPAQVVRLPQGRGRYRHTNNASRPYVRIPPRLPSHRPNTHSVQRSANVRQLSSNNSMVSEAELSSSDSTIVCQPPFSTAHTMYEPLPPSPPPPPPPSPSHHLGWRPNYLPVNARQLPGTQSMAAQPGIDVNVTRQQSDASDSSLLPSYSGNNNSGQPSAPPSRPVFSFGTDMHHDFTPSLNNAGYAVSPYSQYSAQFMPQGMVVNAGSGVYGTNHNTNNVYARAAYFDNPSGLVHGNIAEVWAPDCGQVMDSYAQAAMHYGYNGPNAIGTYAFQDAHPPVWNLPTYIPATVYHSDSQAIGWQLGVLMNDGAMATESQVDNDIFDNNVAEQPSHTGMMDHAPKLGSSPGEDFYNSSAAHALSGTRTDTADDEAARGRSPVSADNSGSCFFIGPDNESPDGITPRDLAFIQEEFGDNDDFVLGYLEDIFRPSSDDRGA